MTRVESYNEIEEILRSDDFLQGSHLETRMFIGDSLLTLHGPEHLERRRILSSIVSRASLDHLEFDQLVPLIDHVMAELKTQRGPDGLVRADIITIVRMFLHRVSAVVTGVDDVETGEQTERFRWFVEKLGEGLSAEWDTRSHDEVIRIGMINRANFINDFLRPSVERRRQLVRRFKAGEIDRKSLPNDMFTLLLLHWDESWEEDYLWREACLFMVGATQTTTHIFPHMLVHLTEWFEAHPEDYEKRHDPEFLRLAEYETLRLHQPAPTLVRIALKDMVLSTGRKVSKDEHIALFFTPANRESEIWGADSRQFNPYRTAPEHARPWGLTFGAGTHICLGRPIVTGLSRKGGDDVTATQGTILRMMGALIDAGAEFDPNDPPKRVTTSYFDAFERMPVILRNL
jgi:cytochrome P450